MPLKDEISYRFSDLPNYRGDQHWDYLQLEAFHSSQEERVGFLRVAYVSVLVGEVFNHNRLLIPQKEGESIYPKYEIQKEGKSLWRDETCWDRWKDNAKNASKFTSRALNESWSKSEDRINQSTNDELIAFVKENKKHIHQHTDKNIQDMFNFAVNKADVDYISVEGRFQRHGIAGEMYKSMAIYLDRTLGITLNSSTCQSSDAKRCWDSMERRGLAKEISGRRFFTYGISPETLQCRDVSPLNIEIEKVKVGRRVGMM